ncbi:DUF998 domain-containing protein [Pseudoxanthomonas composti]|uniref:DUF998 domain-containing protein n=1 Tax=Pseudoxanthomonas composti TaxID=2137479 RepID=A0A4Q1JWB8_9GAMM|nr:DUF998 domain-containing protein [Pseudoxanthomonas composti]
MQPQGAAPSPTIPPASSVRLANFALASLAAFVLASLALHALRPELDPVRSQMSLYLIGKGGHLLQAAYCGLSVGMVALALGLYRALAPAARSAAPLLLFALAGLSLTVTAFAWMDMPGVDRTVEGLIHGVSAQAAFLFATTGAILQALRFGHDPAWRGHRRWALPWALACFGAVWVLALWREAPRGLAQKAVIGLILGWMAVAAWQLRTQARAGNADILT